MSDFGAPYATSYFSAPSDTLDPNLFEGNLLRPQVRQGILALLYGHLNKDYRHPELWAHAWLAGSGVSYQWQAARQPGDLDCLVGVDFVQFRKANPAYLRLSDAEIAQELNEGFYEELQPQTENWEGLYELTFFVNPEATDIRAIKPYAAYDLRFGEWTVHPSHAPQTPHNADWDSVVNGDRHLATQAVTRFTAALQELQMSHGGPAQRNAEARLQAAMQQGDALYHEIHENRSLAFSPTGEGYGDFHNYRWQAGKRAGTVQDLRRIHDHAHVLRQTHEQSTYGMELPDVTTLIRRAALAGGR